MIGEIKHIERYKQIISFEGLERMRRIRPTDIDGMIDYNGKSFLYLECKKDGKALDLGQRLALENAVKSHERAGHKACAIVFTHDNRPEEAIVAKDKKVLQVFMKYAGGFYWKNTAKDCTVLEAIVKWESYCKSIGIEL